MPKIIKPVAKGDFTAATISVDSQGRVVTAASGSAGSEGFQPTLLATGPASGTFTADSNSNRIVIYTASGAGGAGGNATQAQRAGGRAGCGAFAIYSHPISAPFSKAYEVGVQGNDGGGGTSGTPGNAGGTTSLTDVFNINGGARGNGATNNSPGNAGSAGSVSNSPVSATFSAAGNNLNTSDTARYMVPFQSGVARPAGNSPSSFGGYNLGMPGDMVILENKD